MDKREERLFRALGEVGSDLIHTAEHKKFPKSPWQRLLPAAACAAVIMTAALLLLPRLRDPAQTQTAAVPQKPAADASVPMTQGQAAAASKERLTIGHTIYYREAFHTAAAAQKRLGAYVGTVSAADGQDLEGAEAYAEQDCVWKNGMPQTVFVRYQDGYVYCRTFFTGEGMPDSMEQWRQILTQTEFPADWLTITFRHARELDSRQLYDFFLMTLALEEASGQRTEELNRYLWYQPERKAYVIPKGDVTRQLSRYLHGYVFAPADCRDYDPVLEAVCPERLRPEGETEHLILEQVHMEDPDSGSLKLRARTSKTNRVLQYEMEMTGEGCIFKRIAVLSDDGGAAAETGAPKEE